MKDYIVSLVIIGVCLIVSAIIIRIAFIPVNAGVNLTNTAMGQLTRVITTDNVDYGIKLSGQLKGLEVRELAKEFNDSGVYTLTTVPANHAGFYSAKGMDDPSSTSYVADDGAYYGKTVSSDNGIVIAVLFREDSCDYGTFNLSTADAVSDSVEMNLVNAQYKFYQRVKANKELCKQSLGLCKEYAVAMDRLQKAFMDRLYRKTTNTTVEPQDMSFYVSMFNQQTEFLNKLADSIDVWTASGWYAPLYYTNDVTSGGGDDDFDDFFDDDDDDDISYGDVVIVSSAPASAATPTPGLEASPSPSSGGWSGGGGFMGEGTGDPTPEPEESTPEPTPSHGTVPILEPDLGGG